MNLRLMLHLMSMTALLIIFSSLDHLKYGGMCNICFNTHLSKPNDNSTQHHVLQ